MARSNTLKKEGWLLLVHLWFNSLIKGHRPDLLMHTSCSIYNILSSIMLSRCSKTIEVCCPCPLSFCSNCDTVPNIQCGYLWDHMPTAGEENGRQPTLNQQMNNGPLCSIICWAVKLRAAVCSEHIRTVEGLTLNKNICYLLWASV